MDVEETKVGWFQIVLLFILSINYVIVSMSHALPVFHNYTPKFYCESTDGTNRTYGCSSSVALVNASMESHGGNGDNVASCTSGYTWEADTTERSVVTDWTLICEKSYLMYLGPTVYYVGISIGAWVAGILADRVGRLPVLAICLYTQGTMAVATYIVQSYPAFLVLRGLQGVFAQGLQNTTYILTLELFPKKFRTIVATTMEFFWALGIILLAALSYMIPDWRILQLAVSVPTAVTVLYIWIIPESPRWLSAKGKSTEADISLEKLVQYNACCSGGNRSRALVAETAGQSDSANATPVKPERKSRLIRSSVDESSTKETRKEDEACELTNLLTPPNPVQRKSRRTSLRAITENLEKRLSIVEPAPRPEVTTRREDTSLDESLEATSSARSNDDRTRLSSCPSGCPETSNVVDESKENENDEQVSIVRNEPTDVNVGEQTAVAAKKEETRDIEKVQETGVNTRRNRYLTKYLLVMACEWFTASVTRSALGEISPEMSKNRHVSFAIGGGLEMIAYALTYFALSRYGRRIPMSLCQFVNGAVCITVGVIAVLAHAAAAWIGPVRLVILVIGKISVGCLLATAYLFTVEIFPTVRRGACLGLCTIAGMLGSLSSPHILSLEFRDDIQKPNFLSLQKCISTLLTKSSTVQNSYENQHDYAFVPETSTFPYSLRKPGCLIFTVKTSVKGMVIVECLKNLGDVQLEWKLCQAWPRNHTTIAAPLSITGILCLVSGLISLILPETMNVTLPDTVTQIGRTLTKNKIGVASCESEKSEDGRASKREILREKLFSEDWVDAGNGIIVNFSDNKN